MKENAAGEIELKKRAVRPVLNYLWIENLARP